jgi:kynurenine 3-monooxygenase
MSDRVTIVGAGLAGALMAIFLARRGLSVTMIEKRPDMRREAIPAGRSINLALANRGLKPLRAVGLEEQVRALLTTMRGRMIHDEEGHTELQPYGQQPWEVIYSVSRPGLNSLLLDEAEAAGADIRFDCACSGIDLERGRLSWRHEPTGEETHVDLTPCIAADGAGSVVRDALVAQAGCTATVDWLEHSYKELCIFPDADGGFRMDPNALHIWPRGGYMLIALPNLDGSFTVTLFLANEGDPGFDSLETTGAVRRFFDAKFVDASALLPHLETEFFDNPTGILGTVRSGPWNAGGSLCLLGDAAHAVVPFHGQGMNAAFEDCLEMDRCFEESGGDWDATFARFCERRKPNADAIADMALENYVEMRASVIDPRFLLKKRLAFELERRHPDRFVPRYSMVMFRDDIDYADAQRRGRIQEQILEEATAGHDDLGDVDLDALDDRIRQALAPITD